MKVVILAAGKGVRMGELTRNTPKPMLKIGEKNLIEHKLDALPPECDEVVMIIGYLGDKIQDYFGAEYQGRKFHYVESEPLGTAYSLWQARHLLIDDRFMVMCGDDLYGAEDIKRALDFPQTALVYKKEGSGSGGKIILSDSGTISEIIEGKHEGAHIVATGLYVLKPDIFQYEPVKIPGREEFGLPQTLVAHRLINSIKAIFADSWKQVTTPEDLK